MPERTTVARAARRGRGTGFRFILVGMVNTVIDLAVYGVLATVGWAVVPANFLSTTAGMTFSFFANRTFTFRSPGSVRRTAPLFLIVTVTGLWGIHPLVITAARTLLVEIWSGPLAEVWLPKGAAIAVGMVWNYLLYSTVVFGSAGPGRSGHGRI